MREIMIMYGAVTIIFVTSVAIGFMKSTRDIIVVGGTFNCDFHCLWYFYA